MDEGIWSRMSRRATTSRGPTLRQYRAWMSSAFSKKQDDYGAVNTGSPSQEKKNRLRCSPPNASPSSFLCGVRRRSGSSRGRLNRHAEDGSCMPRDAVQGAHRPRAAVPGLPLSWVYRLRSGVVPTGFRTCPPPCSKGNLRGL